MLSVVDFGRKVERMKTHRRYLVRFASNFSNSYKVVWVNSAYEEKIALAEGYERITREDAVRLCLRERHRRENNLYFSGYASEYILPYGNYELSHPISGFIAEKEDCNIC